MREIIDKDLVQIRNLAADIFAAAEVGKVERLGLYEVTPHL